MSTVQCDKCGEFFKSPQGLGNHRGSKKCQDNRKIVSARSSNSIVSASRRAEIEPECGNCHKRWKTWNGFYNHRCDGEKKHTRRNSDDCGCDDSTVKVVSAKPAFSRYCPPS